MHTVHIKGMFFQFVTTKMANNIRLVRPGPVAKFMMTFFISTCASDIPPATATEPTPIGRMYPNAFAEAIVAFQRALPAAFRE